MLITALVVALHPRLALRRRASRSSALVALQPQDESFTLSFADFDGLADTPGACALSTPFETADASRWCVVLYPSGVGAARAGKVGVYLRLLDERVEIDASFDFRLRAGRYSWSSPAECRGGDSSPYWCGMTFTPPAEAVESVGRCHDWGFHACDRADISHALGGAPLEIDVTLRCWERRDLRQGAAARAVAAQVQRPAVRSGEVRVAMGDGADVVRGAEYRVMSVEAPSGEPKWAATAADDVLWIRPTVRVAPANVRDWPVRAVAGALPVLASRFDPAAQPARVQHAALADGFAFLLTLALAISPLPIGFVASQFGSVYVIPTQSMAATLKVNDVVVAEKVSAKLRAGELRRGELVLFTPPPALQALVGEAGGRIGDRDLFVKRVAAVAGDRVEVQAGGSVLVNGAAPPRQPAACDAAAFDNQRIEELATPRQLVVPRGAYFVLGDCAPASVDSRVWGTVDKAAVVARPVARIWPPGGPRIE